MANDADPAIPILHKMTVELINGFGKLLGEGRDTPEQMMCPGDVLPALQDVITVIARLSMLRRSYATGEYSEYLKSKQWRSIRSEVIARDRKCVKCGSMENLQVHHKTYERRGFEKLSDLEALCKSCHKIEHQK